MHGKYSADIGIIGGTGIYTAELFGIEKQVKVYTPYGKPSDLISIGEYAGRTIAFLPRHGRGHTIPLIGSTAALTFGRYGSLASQD